MTLQPDHVALFLAMGVVTYLPRLLPLLFISRRQLPGALEAWLDFVPASILSALVLPALVTAGEPRHLDLFRREFFVAIPTLIFALKTRSLVGTVLVGMGLFWLAGKVLS